MRALLTYNNRDVCPVPRDLEGGCEGVWRCERVGKKCLDRGKTKVVCLAEVPGKIAWECWLIIRIISKVPRVPCLLYSASLLFSKELLFSYWSWWSFTSLNRELNWTEIPWRSSFLWSLRVSICCNLTDISAIFWTISSSAERSGLG